MFIDNAKKDAAKQHLVDLVVAKESRIDLTEESYPGDKRKRLDDDWSDFCKMKRKFLEKRSNLESTNDDGTPPRTRENVDRMISKYSVEELHEDHTLDYWRKFCETDSAIEKQAFVKVAI